ncbi:MAG: TlpA family protein disulfide reductase [Deltaproteobacteria bacterium]|nr:TlpA family protein disulfide reductase [Deltaproteobacteria bacterium]
MRMRAQLLALALAAGITMSAGGVASAGVGEGDHFVELDVAKSATGKKFKLKDEAGNWVLFTFGASWCKPCGKELPAWNKLAARYKGKVKFLAVNINNELEDGKKFVAKLKLGNMSVVYLPDDKSSAMDSYDPDHMPSTFVIDPNGIIRLVHYGYEKGDEKKLAAKLDALVK